MLPYDMFWYPDVNPERSHQRQRWRKVPTNLNCESGDSCKTEGDCTVDISTENAGDTMTMSIGGDGTTLHNGDIVTGEDPDGCSVVCTGTGSLCQLVENMVAKEE